MRRVELTYDPKCPNVEAARRALRQAFAQSKQPAGWREWLRGAGESPSYRTCCGSPTILVDGNDIEGRNESASDSSSCRRYARSSGGFQGTPPVETIVRALGSNSLRSTWPRLAAALPGAGFLLLPVGACPACWPAYAGLLSSLGLGVLLDGYYLAPLLVVMLAASLGSLAYRARERRGLGPFVLGLGGAAAALLGKFTLGTDSLLYLGFGVLLLAAAWNAWPKRTSLSCARCTPREPQTKTNLSAHLGEQS